MSFILPLPWPKITDHVASSLIAEFDKNKQFSKKVTRAEGNSLNRTSYRENSQGYFHLTEWPSKLDFLNDLFPQAVNKDNLDRLSIQCSIGELAPHTDFARTASVICILEGAADTVFYQHKTAAETAGKVFQKWELIELQRFRLELGSWYLFNNAAIHGVDNYQGRRLGLTMDLSFAFDSYQSAREKINHSGILFQ